jgi:hypothetical protein
MAITDILTLPRAGRYANAEQDNAILPLPYGNCNENALDDVWVCPRIADFVYCVAGWPVLSVLNGNIVKVYVDGLLITSGYTFDDSNDYEGQGEIAILTFTGDPAGVVSVACSGKCDDAGALITNPVIICSDLCDYAAETGGIPMPSRYTPAWVTSQSVALQKSYSAAGVILSENSPAFWLLSILSCFLGSFWITNAGYLAVSLDSDLFDTYLIKGMIEEYRYDHERIFSKQCAENLSNQIAVNYAPFFVHSDKRYTEDYRNMYAMSSDGSATADIASQTKFGVRLKTLSFDWIRNTATVTTIQERIIEKFAYPVWIYYQVSEQGLQNIHLEKGDLVIFSWEERKDEAGLPLKNQICQILAKTTNFDRQEIEWELLDLDVYYPATPDLWDGTHVYGDGDAWGGSRRA